MKHFILASGLAITTMLVAPNAHAQEEDAPPVLKTYSPALRTAGIVSVSVGGGALLASVGVAIGGIFSTSFWMGSEPAWGYATIGLFAGGAALLAFGIPAIIVGNHKIARDAVAITPIVGPTGGGLRVTF
jgi:hypothetical protein